MKNLIIRSVTTLFLVTFLFIASAVIAQNPPPPPQIHGESGNQTPPGGGVPVGSGIVILLALGAAYGGKKLYDLKNELQ